MPSDREKQLEEENARLRVRVDELEGEFDLRYRAYEEQVKRLSDALEAIRSGQRSVMPKRRPSIAPETVASAIENEPE